MFLSYRQRGWVPFFSLVVILFAGHTAWTHPRLELPNGGETLEVGSEYDIEWQIIIQHEAENWDLYYSTSGESGTWILIAANFEGSESRMRWRLLSRIPV